jgi:hypothetical protein
MDDKRYLSPVNNVTLYLMERLVFVVAASESEASLGSREGREGRSGNIKVHN